MPTVVAAAQNGPMGCPLVGDLTVSGDEHDGGVPGVPRKSVVAERILDRTAVGVRGEVREVVTERALA